MDPTDPDARLVTWAQQSPQAFTALYDRYFPAVYGYCLSQLGDSDAAEDAASQTFLKAQHRPEGDHDLRPDLCAGWRREGDAGVVCGRSRGPDSADSAGQ